jgi:hypothetical protein
MTFYYKTYSWANNSTPKVTEEQIEHLNHVVKKQNWRIVQLPNGYYETQYKEHDCDCDPKKDYDCDKWTAVTRRETVEGAESAIDASIEHYKKQLDFAKGPVVVKTFEK